METCNLVYHARVSPINAKIRVPGKVSGACIIQPSGQVFLAGFKRETHMQRCFKEALKLAKLRQRNVLSEPRLVNVTIKLSEPLDLVLDLETIALLVGSDKTRYEPLRFPGIIFKSINVNSNSTGTLFSNGQLLLTGARSEDEGECVMRELRDSIRDMQERVY